jgi:hypothetical protein
MSGTIKGIKGQVKRRKKPSARSRGIAASGRRRSDGGGALDWRDCVNGCTRLVLVPEGFTARCSMCVQKEQIVDEERLTEQVKEMEKRNKAKANRRPAR